MLCSWSNIKLLACGYIGLPNLFSCIKLTENQKKNLAVSWNARARMWKQLHLHPQYQCLWHPYQYQYPHCYHNQNYPHHFYHIIITIMTIIPTFLTSIIIHIITIILFLILILMKTLKLLTINWIIDILWSHCVNNIDVRRDLLHLLYSIQIPVVDTE